LPGAAAAIAGDDPGPAACPDIACEPAAAAGARQADGDGDRHHAVRLMPPVTLPPPADETRAPDTAKGTLLVALQLPSRVAKTTFQVPS